MKRKRGVKRKKEEEKQRQEENRRNSICPMWTCKLLLVPIVFRINIALSFPPVFHLIYFKRKLHGIQFDHSFWESINEVDFLLKFLIKLVA